jgi:hypothetical protein
MRLAKFGKRPSFWGSESVGVFVRREQEDLVEGAADARGRCGDVAHGVAQREAAHAVGHQVQALSAVLVGREFFEEVCHFLEATAQCDARGFGVVAVVEVGALFRRTVRGPTEKHEHCGVCCVVFYKCEGFIEGAAEVVVVAVDVKDEVFAAA